MSAILQILVAPKEAEVSKAAEAASGESEAGSGGEAMEAVEEAGLGLLRGSTDAVGTLRRWCGRARAPG